jgi:hypothetical protein
MREYTDMSLLPGGQGLVVTTGDSRLLLLKADPVSRQGGRWCRINTL